MNNPKLRRRGGAGGISAEKPAPTLTDHRTMQALPRPGAKIDITKSFNELPKTVQNNFMRFQKRLPANAKSNASIERLANGDYRFTGVSEGKVPGSKAIYEKTADSLGNTTNYIKTTIDPQGNIVHIKNKIPPE